MGLYLSRWIWNIFQKQYDQMVHNYAHYNLLTTTAIIIIITQNAYIFTQCKYLVKPLLMSSKTSPSGLGSLYA
jgi:hypothetical protein